MAERLISVGETIVRARDREPTAGATGVGLYTFVSEGCGATSFSTGIARMEPGGCLPYHKHDFSEAVTVVAGEARVQVEGREYRLGQTDCVHFPRGVAHQVSNAGADKELVLHWAFATAEPTRIMVHEPFTVVDRGDGMPAEGDPETIIRYGSEAVYELSKDAFFIDLFARRYGSVGICGGHGRFLPSASLPCHTHDFDESITIVKGRAVCLVQGRRYELSDCDCAFIPKGLPHRFLNLSNEPMEMVWVYAGSEPDRQMVDTMYCSGELIWPGAQ